MSETLTVCRYYHLRSDLSCASAEKAFAYGWDRPGDGDELRDEYLRLSAEAGDCEVVAGAVPSGCDIDNYKVTVYRWRQSPGDPWGYFGLAVIPA